MVVNTHYTLLYSFFLLNKLGKHAKNYRHRLEKSEFLPYIYAQKELKPKTDQNWYCLCYASGNQKDRLCSNGGVSEGICYIVQN